LLLQLVEHGIAQVLRLGGHLDRVVAHQPVDLVQARAVGLQNVGHVLRRQALVDQARAVVGDAVAAFVELGHYDQRDFEIALG